MLARALAEPALRDRGRHRAGGGRRLARRGARASGELRDSASASGLGERLRLVGFRDDLETVLGAADVVVVPSTQPDPLPNAALEAAAAGCCVVAADHGGLPEIVRDGETGVLVRPATRRRWPARGLAEDPATRATPAARPRPRRARPLSADALLDGVQELYDELLAPRSERAGRSVLGGGRRAGRASVLTRRPQRDEFPPVGTERASVA